MQSFYVTAGGIHSYHHILDGYKATGCTTQAMKMQKIHAKNLPYRTANKEFGV
jgi:hypothetical protein